MRFVGWLFSLVMRMVWAGIGLAVALKVVADTGASLHEIQQFFAYAVCGGAGMYLGWKAGARIAALMAELSRARVQEGRGAGQGG